MAIDTEASMSATDLPLVIEDAPSADDVDFVASSLDAFNIERTGAHDYRPLAIFLRDDAGTIAGGLTGFTWGGTLKIQYLWLREDWRGQGYGARLLARVEEEARSRGCQQAILDTHEFQAPDFYEKQGYTCCGVAD